MTFKVSSIFGARQQDSRDTIPLSQDKAQQFERVAADVETGETGETPRWALWASAGVTDHAAHRGPGRDQALRSRSGRRSPQPSVAFASVGTWSAVQTSPTNCIGSGCMARRVGQAAIPAHPGDAHPQK
jgi:hypothetical protein